MTGASGLAPVDNAGRDANEVESFELFKVQGEWDTFSSSRAPAACEGLGKLSGIIAYPPPATFTLTFYLKRSSFT